MANAMVAGSATAFRKRGTGKRASRAMGSRRRKEKEQRAISGQHQFAERQQNMDAKMPDGVGHGRAHADGRVIHDDVGEAKHRLRQRFGEIQDGQARFFRNLRQRDAEQNRKHGDLQNLVFADRFYDVFRENVQQKIIPPAAVVTFCGACSVVIAGSRQSHSGARQVDGRHPKE